MSAGRSARSAPRPAPRPGLNEYDSILGFCFVEALII